MTVTDHDFTVVSNGYNLTLNPVSVETLWVNITSRCNQSCRHCHVDASPSRSEEMDLATIDQCLKVLKSLEGCRNLDITGGAPELHPNFEYLVTKARGIGKHVIVRHNLTVTLDGDIRNGTRKTHLPAFFVENQVEILASLPSYFKSDTDAIRGEGVFEKSIRSLKSLNALGYGQPGSGRVLNLVCNQAGPISLQARTQLESAFRRELGIRHGVVFNRLLAVTNLPINRFRNLLDRSNDYNDYQGKLEAAFDPVSIPALVCRYLVSVGHDGRLYDCDFNQMLGMAIYAPRPQTIFNFDLSALQDRQIHFGPHCFGCTAGGGSS